MANKNYREFLQGKDVKIKKYFYVLRPILACKWIEEKHTVPPIDFHELVDTMVSDQHLKREIELLLQRKIAGDEMDLEPRIQRINDFLQSEMIRLEAYVKTISIEIEDPTEKLNVLFRNTLKEVWE